MQKAVILKLEAIKSLRDFVGLKLQLKENRQFDQIQVDNLNGIFLSNGIVCVNLINIGDPDGVVPILSFWESDGQLVCPTFPIKKTTKISTRKNARGKYPFIVTIDNGKQENRILRVKEKNSMKEYARILRAIIQKTKKINF